MKIFLLFIQLLLAGFFSQLQASPSSSKDPNLTIFGRGMYPGDDSTYDNLRTSGFNTVVLSSFYIHANGEVYSGDDSKNPIIRDGQYIGNKEWLQRVASLKKRHSSIKRIEILLEGRWFNQPPNTYDFIQDWSDTSKSIQGIVTGTGKNSTLYKICKIFKDEMGIDAVCIDDESVYNSVSIIRFGEMVGKLKMHMTLCPFTRAVYWKEIIAGSRKGLVDFIYLQCYDGGARNTPAPWVKSLDTDLPIYPMFLCRGSYSTCTASHNSKTPEEIKGEMVRFKKDYPAMAGGAIWQMADLKDYIKLNCAVQTPESGGAVSVSQYLAQLKNNLKEGLQ